MWPPARSCAASTWARSATRTASGTQAERCIFTAEGYKAIGRYDPATNRIDWWHGIGQNRTHMLVLSKDLKKIFTANGDAGARSASDTVSIIEGSGPADWKVTVLPVRNGPEAIEISPDGKEVWTASRTDGGVSVVDVATSKITRTFSVHTKGSNRLKFTPDGKLVLISDNPGGELAVLDATAGKVIKRLQIGKTTTGILIVPMARERTSPRKGRTTWR